MTAPITPALTAEEWADVKSTERGTSVRRGSVYAVFLEGSRARIGGGDMDGVIDIEREEAPLVIALANATLPDDDPRKITRERLMAVQKGIDIWFSELVRTGDPEDREPHYAVIKFLAALASYLPPAE